MREIRVLCRKRGGVVPLWTLERPVQELMHVRIHDRRKKKYFTKEQFLMQNPDKFIVDRSGEKVVILNEDQDWVGGRLAGEMFYYSPWWRHDPRYRDKSKPKYIRETVPEVEPVDSGTQNPDSNIDDVERRQHSETVKSVVVEKPKRLALRQRKREKSGEARL